MTQSADRSLGELFASLARDLPNLLAKEIRLARVEARAALDHLAGALGRILLAVAFAVGAVGLGLAAMVSGLSAWLVSLGIDPPLAAALATAAATIVAAALAAGFYWSARRSLRAARQSLDGSMTTLAQTVGGVVDKL